MINPMKLMKIKNAWSRFAANHPKFPLFLNAIVKKGIQEETILNLRLPIRTASSSSPICASVRKISNSGRKFPKLYAKLIFFSQSAAPDASPTCSSTALVPL